MKCSNTPEPHVKADLNGIEHFCMFEAFSSGSIHIIRIPGSN